MKKSIKFSTQIEDEKVLSLLKTHAKENRQKISFIVTQALDEYLKKYNVRPAFRQSMKNVIRQNKELLKKLAS